ncbi:MAG: twin-arginine translocation signal domain-containing protein [Hyphomicrobiales bacterium]|nr:twin-arginine translocation signal domain-containing protein [Hyphomicrobiales bacterium]MCP5372421.1 twin-arginine translocation signal domain-containing protein [Hyphomicrobiales bacterium]
MNRRNFLKTSTALAGAAAVGLPGASRAANAGAKVETPSLITSTAKFDPVRPETARLIAQAAKQIGFDIDANPIDYNQGIQKVIMQHDYDMFLVRLTGSSVRIDPNVFIHDVHNSSNYKKGGYNWTGYKNAKVDELSAAQQSEMDVEKRRELVYQAQVLIDEDQANHVVVNPEMTNAYRSDRIDNLVPQMGEGIGSFWTDIAMTPKGGDGYVRTGATVALKNLNPVAVKDANEFKELRMIYDRLFRIGPDGKPAPWAAKSFTLVDNTTIDIVIRDGMKWHDGKPVTAEDVKFSFDYQKQWKAPFFAKSLEKIASIDVTGANSLRFKLTDPFAPLLSNLFGALFLIPKHIWQDIPAKVDVDDPLNFANEKPVGSGPFKFDYWDRGKEFKVSANKDHFNPPKCAGIIRIVYGSHDAMAAAIEKGECDRTRYILKPSLMDDLNKIEGVVGKGYPSHGFYCLSYNLMKPPFDNAVIRKAMKYVIPKDLIRDVVLGGHAGAGGSVIGPANAFWHNAAVKAPSQDIAMAKKILSDAGFTWKGGKLHYPG